MIKVHSQFGKVEELCQQTQKLIAEIFTGLRNQIIEKLNQFEIDFSRELEKEKDYFKAIQEDIEFYESLEKLQHQIKIKLYKVKEYENQTLELGLSPKLFAANPVNNVQTQKPPIKRRIGDSIEIGGENQRFFTCPFCQAKKDTSFAARSHLRIIHQKEDNLLCPHCPFRTGTSGVLASHLLEQHRGNKADPHHPKKKIYTQKFPTIRGLGELIAREMRYLSKPDNNDLLFM